MTDHIYRGPTRTEQEAADLEKADALLDDAYYLRARAAGGTDPRPTGYDLMHRDADRENAEADLANALAVEEEL